MHSINQKTKPGVFNPAPQRQRQGVFCEFKAGLVYIVRRYLNKKLIKIKNLENQEESLAISNTLILSPQENIFYIKMNTKEIT